MTFPSLDPVAQQPGLLAGYAQPPRPRRVRRDLVLDRGPVPGQGGDHLPAGHVSGPPSKAHDASPGFDRSARLDRIGPDLVVLGDRYPSVSGHPGDPVDVQHTTRQVFGDWLDPAGHRIGSRPHQGIADAKDFLVDVEADLFQWPGPRLW